MLNVLPPVPSCCTTITPVSPVTQPDIANVLLPFKVTLAFEPNDGLNVIVDVALLNVCWSIVILPSDICKSLSITTSGNILTSVLSYVNTFASVPPGFEDIILNLPKFVPLSPWNAISVLSVPLPCILTPLPPSLVIFKEPLAPLAPFTKRALAANVKFPSALIPPEPSEVNTSLLFPGTVDSVPFCPFIPVIPCIPCVPVIP